MNIKKVLVTGGAGFIGSHMASYLSKMGHEVIVLDALRNGNKLAKDEPSNIQLLEGDTRDKKAVFKAANDCDLIIHLAAVVGVDEVIEDPIEMIEIETIGTANIVEAAIENRTKKIIYASSSAVYHKLESDFNREEDELHLVNTYAIAKCLNERYLAAVAESENISTNSIRLFNVYGSNQDNRMVIPRFFEKALLNQPIQVFGCGTQTRDFTHVNDVIKGIWSLGQRNELHGIYNIAREIEISIFDLAKEIKRITRSASPIQLVDFPEKRIAYKVERRIGSSSKLYAHTGFRPEVTLTEGLTHLFKPLQPRSFASVRAKGM